MKLGKPWRIAPCFRSCENLNLIGDGEGGKTPLKTLNRGVDGLKLRKIVQIECLFANDDEWGVQLNGSRFKGCYDLLRNFEV